MLKNAYLKALNLNLDNINAKKGSLLVYTKLGDVQSLARQPIRKID
ncbi:hypothetical protein AGMMS50222_05230 [Endomicrobiia bacterium]|nr:hypothetical protein AGMMS49531_06710 [Endomicrobiia bacterium]GHT75031.1 hypothetical protein AGMMS50222_05230 [Endomicrobiia bacterium]